ncbi:KIAA0895 like [Phyllostomus discolor]|uniref:KIAA0895 like n=1 Tax=Phyllostomus discolor TaxID=89673 RepID=A0A833YR98_9CHIR|nr:KIAA0895 like [Phyllostomus discolor]
MEATVLAGAPACWWPCGQPTWTVSGTSSSSPSTPTTRSSNTRSPCPRLCWRSTVRPLASSSIRSVQPTHLSLAPATREARPDQPPRPCVQAVGIIEAVLEKFGTYEHFEAVTGGQLLTKCQIWSVVRKYMQKEGCVGEVVVQLSEDLLSQAVMMVENSRPTLAINLTGARQYWLEGMLRHEIGTHYLRGVNNARQPWHSAEGRLQYGLRPANPTEEGLASLHSVLFRKQPFLWRAALLYYTIYRAAQMSFRQLFQDLARYVQDADVRWEYCVRAKRGQTDTSLPGCFSKDQVYLDGIVRILRHRQTIDFPLLTSLGKVSYEDVDHLRPHGVLDNTRVPHFMQDLARYRQQLEHIMTTNRLDEAELGRLLPD